MQRNAFEKRKLTFNTSAFVGKIDAVENVVAENVSRETASRVARPRASWACPCVQQRYTVITPPQQQLESPHSRSHRSLHHKEVNKQPTSTVLRARLVLSSGDSECIRYLVICIHNGKKIIFFFCDL